MGVTAFVAVLGLGNTATKCAAAASGAFLLLFLLVGGDAIEAFSCLGLFLLVVDGAVLLLLSW